MTDNYRLVKDAAHVIPHLRNEAPIGPVMIGMSSWQAIWRIFVTARPDDDQDEVSSRSRSKSYLAYRTLTQGRMPETFE